MTATAATGGFPPQRSEPPAFLAPGCRAASQNPADGTVSINFHYCMKEKFTAAVRKEDRACKKKRNWMNILQKTSRLVCCQSILRNYIQKHFFSQNLQLPMPLPFRSDAIRFCEFALFDSTEEDNDDKRKNKKQRRQVCERGWCNPGPQAWTLAPIGSLKQCTKWLHWHRLNQGWSTFNVFPGFSPEGKTSTTKSLSLFNAGQAVKSSGRFSKLPDSILGESPSSEDSHVYLKVHWRRKKMPAGYLHVAFITRQTAHSK